MFDLRPLTRRLGALVAAIAATAAPLAAHAAARATADGGQAARQAYFAGDVAGALKLAQTTGEHWIGGLSAFRLKKYADAEAAFDRVAHDAKGSEQVRAAAAYWASRAALAAGHEDAADADLKLAAAAPRTFYGMIAERKLKLDAGKADEPSLGAKAAAWLAKFPTPKLEPQGGFTVEKALVYALVRQESRFRADAVGGQAVGLMQLTPSTAARMNGGAVGASLKDPGVNLKLGQAYVAKLLGAVKGDVVRALAGYNTGSTARRVDGGDSLLALESTPGDATRAFVQNVMVAYWSYQRIFGGGSAALDAAARGGPLLASMGE